MDGTLPSRDETQEDRPANHQHYLFYHRITHLRAYLCPNWPLDYVLACKASIQSATSPVLAQCELLPIPLDIVVS
jgi:hypothetical protein